ncbi:MAG: peptidase domain protein, partial [Planctomycetaceae bacterium]|nr:peptidase domain protein [Planctomycetaceae bacterium]
MFIRPWLENLKSRWMPGNRLNKRRTPERMPVQADVESLEDRSLLSAFDLITVIPNQGVFLNDGDKLTQAPSEVTLRFSPGQTITQASLGSISIVRSGVDGIFDNPATPTIESADDVNVPIGYVGLGNLPNEVIVRFAQTLVDDNYQIHIQGAGAGSIASVTGDAFNSGANKTFNFSLDLGAQVQSVVPQPIIRSSVFSTTGIGSLTNGDVVTITAGAHTYKFEINPLPSSTNLPVIVAPGSTAAQIADDLVAAINNPANTGGQLSANDGGTNTITVTGAAFEPLVTFNTSKIDAFAKTYLTIADVTKLSDGDLIKVTFNNVVYTFELNKTPNNITAPGN